MYPVASRQFTLLLSKGINISVNRIESKKASFSAGLSNFFRDDRSYDLRDGSFVIKLLLNSVKACPVQTPETAHSSYPVFFYHRE
jgi:hypothetical protein